MTGTSGSERPDRTCTDTGMAPVVVSTRGPWQPAITTEGGRTVAGFTTTHTTYDRGFNAYMGYY